MIVEVPYTTMWIEDRGINSVPIFMHNISKTIILTENDEAKMLDYHGHVVVKLKKITKTKLQQVS